MTKQLAGFFVVGLCLALAPAVQPGTSSRACAQGGVDCPDEWENWETGKDCEFTGTTVEHGPYEFCAYDCDGKIVLVHGAESPT